MIVAVLLLAFVQPGPGATSDEGAISRSEFLGIYWRTTGFGIRLGTKTVRMTSGGRWTQKEEAVWEGDTVVIGRPSLAIRTPVGLTAVKWGERHYLLGRLDELAFCTAIAKGTEPRKEQFGGFYLREGDQRRAVGNKPPGLCATQ